MKVEIMFFHDVLCPWCYLASRRVREVIKRVEGKDVEIIHKAYPLIDDLDDLKASYPSVEDFREYLYKEFELLKKFDPEVNPEVIKKSGIGYVYSIPPLRACKAAEFQGGQEGHWNFFDTAQRYYFREGRDVSNEEVLIEIAKEVGLNISRFVEDFRSKRSKLAALSDYHDAKAIGIKGVPALWVNNRWLIRGVPVVEELVKAIEDLRDFGEPRRVKLKEIWEAYKD
jgi:predicted DsbA family dithiol-disulfide isomerase